MEPAGYFIFLPAKWTLASALALAGVAALIIQRQPLARSAPVVAMGALVGVFVLAALAGVGGLTSWIGYPGRYLGVLAWVVFLAAFALGASLSKRSDRCLILVVASAASVLVSLYAILQAIGIDPIEWSAELDVSRTRSTLGNAAFLGAYLAMIVPIAARLALSTSEPVASRALHAGTALLGVVALITTETRGAWLGASAGIVVVLALEHRRLRASPRRSAALLGAGLLVIVVLAVVGPIAGRIRSIADPTEATGRGRLVQWERTVELIGDRPVLGWGPETYAFTFPEHIDAEFEQKVGRTVVPDRAHNLFLDLGATTGALGVVAFLVVIAAVAGAVARMGDRDPVAVALAGASVAYLVQLQFSFSVADLDTVFWLLAGMLVAPTGLASLTVDRRWAALPLTAALVLGAWGASEVVADRTLRSSLDAEATGEFAHAQELVDRAADRAPARAQYRQAAARLHRRVGEVTRREEDFGRAMAAIADARRLVPRDLELALDRADILLAWGEATGDFDLIERAAAAYEEVLERDPASSRAHLRLGVAYVQIDRAGDAERAWLTSSELAPRSPGPLVNLGLLYAQEGRDSEARRLLQRALALDPGNSMARDALARVGS